jgi:hypothetical protein
MSDDSLHGDPILDARALETQQLAASIAARTAKALRLLGYELVIVRIAKVVHGEGENRGLPGATAAIVEPVVGPCLRMEAEELRSVAARLDEEFARLSPGSEAEAGYTEETSPEAYGL